MLKLFSKIVTSKPKIIVTFALLLVIPCIFGYIATEINYDVLSYLPKDSESVQGQEVLEDVFNNASMSMVIIDGMSDADVLKTADKIRKIDGVSDVTALRDIVGIGVPKDFLPKDVKNMFYSDTGSMIMVKYSDPSASDRTFKAIEQIRETVRKQGYVSGLSVIIKDLRTLMGDEMIIYVVVAGICALLAMLFTIESYIVPFLFLLTLFLSIAYNFGTNVIFGEISYVTTSLAAILQLAVTMDYAIFLITRYDEEKQTSENKKLAMQKAVVESFTALAGSSLTTVAGFGALCFMKLGLGKDIGLVMMKGVIISIFTILTVLPSLILIFDKSIHKYTHKTLNPNLDKLTLFIEKRKVRSVIVFIILFIPVFYLQSRTAIYYNIDRSLPETLPSNVANNKLKTDFDMATVHFAVMKDNLTYFETKDMIKQIEQVKGVKNVIAYEKFIGPMIPENFAPEKLTQTFKKDGYQMLMIISEYKVATDKVNEQVRKISDILKTYDKNAKVTGEAPLTYDLKNTVDKDIKTTNLISALAIMLIVSFAFKSLTLPIILVSSIEFAIFLNMGLPVVTDTTVSFVAPLVIGAIQLGATVDYAILMTTRYREARYTGLRGDAAMTYAVKNSAKSIFTSALVFFSVTVGVSRVTSMEIVKDICIMLARGSVISAAVILVMLPALLAVFAGVIDKTTKNWSGKV